MSVWPRLPRLILPAPLMNRARRAGLNPFFEGMGRGGDSFFCPVGQRPKVGGECARNWWISALFHAKSLIFERYSITNSVLSSIKLPVLSTNCPFFPRAVFSAPDPLSLSFSFVNKEEEKR